MLRILEHSLPDTKNIKALSNAIKGDREAFLQLLLSLRRKDTLDRIVDCPTYPVRIVTPDLNERISLFKDIVAADPLKISHILSILYEATTKREYRKCHGQYFTAPVVAEEAVSSLALENGETVLDPGCGTGIFAMTILRELVENSKEEQTITYVGIENNSLLALSTAISLDWVEAPRSWRVIYANFLLLNSEYLARIGVSKTNAVIANPPFVRVHRLDKRDNLTGKLGLSQLSGLHSFFLAHSARLLQPDRMVFVLPTEMYGTNYGSDLLDKLESCYTSSKKGICYDWRTCRYTFPEMSANHFRDQIVGTIALFRSISPMRPARLSASQQEKTNRHGIVLGNISTVHRGISTGANSFFVLTDESVEKNGIPREYLGKVMPPKTERELLRDIFDRQDWEKLRLMGRPCWLLCLPAQIPIDDLSSDIKQYIKMGERQGVHLTPTCMGRKRWYSIKIPKTPEMFFTYVSRGYPKLIYNKAKVLNLTNFLGIYLKLPVIDSGKLGRIASRLNEDITCWIDQEVVGRNYARGLTQFTPKDLEGLPISKSVLASLGITSLDICLQQEANRDSLAF